MPLKILMSGTNGVIGQTLVRFLKSGGHKVTPLVRAKPNETVQGAAWRPADDYIDMDACEDHDAVIHLAASNVGDKRWNDAVKKEIRDSRILGTGTIARALPKLEKPPKVFLSASATGYYGDRGEEELTEESAPGQGFLPELVKDWEAASMEANKKGIRVVQMRIGVVLTPEGGALAQMLGVFRKGFGGVLGSGSQYWSWVSLDDVLSAIMFLLSAEQVSGPVNIVSPNPVTNREFTKTLAKAMSKPSFMKVPGFLLKMVRGEMVNELVLASTKVKPARLQQAGFTFGYPDLEPLLNRLVG